MFIAGKKLFCILIPSQHFLLETKRYIVEKVFTKQFSFILLTCKFDNLSLTCVRTHEKYSIVSCHLHNPGEFISVVREYKIYLYFL